MKYIVVCKDQTAFYTNWFTKEDNWSDDILCVIDTDIDMISFDGDNWKKVPIDRL